MCVKDALVSRLKPIRRRGFYMLNEKKQKCAIVKITKVTIQLRDKLRDH